MMKKKMLSSGFISLVLLGWWCLLMSTAVATTSITLETPPRLRAHHYHHLQSNTLDVNVDDSNKGHDHQQLVVSSSHRELAGPAAASSVKVSDHPTCIEMGYDYGWKTSDRGCAPMAQAFDGGFLEKVVDTENKDCDINDGNFHMMCQGTPAANGTYPNMFLKVYNTGQDTIGVLILDAEGNGKLYTMISSNEFTKNMNPGTGENIETILFCFHCPTIAPSVAPTMGSPTTVAPTECDLCQIPPNITLHIPKNDTVCPQNIPMPHLDDVSAIDTCGNTVSQSNIQISQERSKVEQDENEMICNGHVYNVYSAVADPNCNETASAVEQQNITVIDDQPPEFTTLIENSTTFECPSKFKVSSLKAPIATDDCDTNVDISWNLTKPVDGCNAVEIEWIASDICGNSISTSQTVNFTDSVAPTLVNTPPQDQLLSCGATIPPPVDLAFVDNCDTEKIYVSPILTPENGFDDFLKDETGNVAGGILNAVKGVVKGAVKKITKKNKDQNDHEEKDDKPKICNGFIVTRTWVGAMDDCGNQADTVSQTFTMQDVFAPELPPSIPDAIFDCPSDFILEELTKPNATDDCDDNVDIVAELSNKTNEDLGLCGTSVIWTAKDIVS